MVFIVGLIIGFVAGILITAYLSVVKAETHDFTLTNGKPRWVERPTKPS